MIQFIKKRLTKWLIATISKNYDELVCSAMSYSLKELKKVENFNIHSTFQRDRLTEFYVYGKVNRVLFEENIICRKFCNFTLYEGANLIVRKNVFLNNYCSINCLGTIEIGENTIFGEGVKVYDHNHENEKSAVGEVHFERNKFKIGSVKIGKNCWIGSNVTILNNVEIGDNVIIGANSLIYRSITSNTTVKAKIEIIMESQSKPTE